MTEQHDHDDFGGLAIDLPRFIGRRRMLQLVGGAAGLAVLTACGSSASDGASTTTDGSSDDTTTTSGDGDLDAIPEETAGPYPGDGSNGPDVLAESGVVRQDITSSFGDMSGTAEGVPLSVELTVLDAATGAGLPGAAVYLWHCTRDGGYSLYSDGITDQNFLRGVQEADAEGKLSFTTIFPGCYSGRWPHIHFEVYESIDAATGDGTITATSQIALPQDTCEEVYATDGYEASVSNLASISLATDNVFSDDEAVDQLPAMSGSVADGYIAQLDIPIDPEGESTGSTDGNGAAPSGGPGTPPN
jgi:protocatechuate 3,4-dioxygenase beta subunit